MGDNPGRYQDYRFVITEMTTTTKSATIQFWRVEVHGLITPTMRNKIQEEEKTIEKSSVDEETMKNAVDYDGGHPAEAMLLMGLAMLFIGFVVIRFKQSRPSIRRRHNNMSVQRPPDGTFEVELDRAHHGEL